MNNEKLKLIFGSNYFVVSRALFKIFKIKTVIMLCELYGEYQYHLKKGDVTKDNYFYSTIQNVQDNTSLTKHDQLGAVKELVEFGIIKMHLHGIPPKRYFRFEDSGISKLALKINEVAASEHEESDKSASDPLPNQQGIGSNPRSTFPPKSGIAF